MKITIERLPFLKILEIASNVADKNSPIPMVSTVLLEADGDGLVCSATNLSVSMKGSVEAQVDSPGRVCLSAKTLYDVVKSLPEEPATLSLEAQSAASATISMGKSVFKIHGMTPDDFPSLPAPSSSEFLELSAEAFITLVRRVFFSISTEETRPHFNSALLEAEAGLLRMVSTDGHRLTKAEITVEHGLVLDSGILIPRRGLTQIRNLAQASDSTITVAVEKPYLFVRSTGIELAVRLVEDEFPAYSEVIPTDLEKKVVVERAKLIDAIKRVSLLATGVTHGIRLQLQSESMKVLSSNPDLGDASEELEVDYDGEEFIVAFNSRYFTDLLPEMDSEEVILEFGEELDPCLVQPVDATDYVAVIMPLRF